METRKILVVDDEEQILDLFSRILSMWGAQQKLTKVVSTLTWCVSADVALEILMRHRYDLVITDHITGRGDIFWHQYLNDEYDGPVLCMSGEEEPRPLYYTTHLKKPFGIVDLYNAINQLLQHPRYATAK